MSAKRRHIQKTWKDFDLMDKRKNNSHKPIFLMPRLRGFIIKKRKMR